ncbi:hypothetical protein V6S02_13280 [Microbacterium sp. CCNWLW134]|uniref:hypothetical protein n=1 Tax=Microbacterium sp. CCNWLW134 TaxID=3122064 RepID=UPI00300FD4E0
MDAVEALAQRAQDRGARLAVAESLTCGLLVSTIGKAEEWGTAPVGWADDTGTGHRILKRLA